MDLNRPISEFFYKKGLINSFLVYSVLFAFLFITLFQPFKNGTVTGFYNFMTTLILSCSGASIIAISRYVARWWGKKHTVTYAQLLFWTLFVELLPLTIIYTIATCLTFGDVWETVIFKTFIYITLLLLLLYSLFVFSVLLRQKSKELKEMRDGTSSTPAKANVQTSNVTLPFYDERGELKVTIHKQNLVYIESADNYIYLWYINKETISKMIIRNSLKSLEVQLAKTNVIRCHRSYMVNLDHVSMIRKDKGDLFAVFDIEGIRDIPVSAGYYDRVLKSFITH